MKRKYIYSQNVPLGITVCEVTLENGKRLKGVAKRHPSDEFDEHLGKVLATLRVEEKVENYLSELIRKQRVALTHRTQKKHEKLSKSQMLHYRSGMVLREKIKNLLENI